MLDRFLHWMGFGLCHQLPERSFFGGGVQVPVCARDTGIYVGFVLSFLLIGWLHRQERPRGFPRWPAWTLMALLLGLMAWDGVSSYAGLRVTTNDLRLITGIGVGFSAALVLFPMLQDELWERSSPGRVLDPSWRLAVWSAAIPVSFALIRWGAPLIGVAYPLVVALCIISSLAGVNLVIIAMLPSFDRKAQRLQDLAAPVAIAVVIALVEIAASGLVRTALERAARTLS